MYRKLCHVVRRPELVKISADVTSLVKNLRANGTYRHGAFGLRSGITVDNDRPPCIQVNPDGADGPYKNIKAGLRDAAIQIWHGTKMDPQLIIVVEAVSIGI